MVKVTVAASLETSLLSKVPAALGKLEQAVIESCDPFVPYRTGELCGSAVVQNDGAANGAVIYTASHAAICYYASRQFSQKYHPQACAHWFEAAKQVDLQKWVQVVTDSFTGGARA